MMKILFVCTGNICRSPSAEAVFRRLVADENLDHLIQSDSVGLHGFHVGEPPDARAVAAAAKRGYPMSDLRARRMRREDFGAFDKLLAMDAGHFEALQKLAVANDRDKIEMFLSVAPNCGASDVPDPFYGTMEGFERALDLIEEGARGWLEKLKQES